MQPDRIVQVAGAERRDHPGSAGGSHEIHGADRRKRRCGECGVRRASRSPCAGICAAYDAGDHSSAQIVAFGGDLVLVDGHIGDCGKASRAYAAETGAMDLSTLREPYRIEGKKTLGLELAMQLNWTLPDAIIYPTGGGTGLIGMWKAFHELRDAGWVTSELPRMYTVQSTGCAPIVKAFDAGATQAEPWPDPWTIASGLRVPGPLGDKLMLKILRETGGGAVAVPDEAMSELAAARAPGPRGSISAPEGGAAIAAAVELQRTGEQSAGE